MQNILIKAAFEVLLNNSVDMIFLKDINLVCQAASMPFVKMVGKDKVEDVIGHTDREIFSDSNLASRYETDDRKIISEGRDLINFIEPITDIDGHPRYGLTSKYLIWDENGKVLGILGITRDITKEYITRLHYQRELSYLFELPEDTYAVCYIDVDDWRIIKQRRQNIADGTVQECRTVGEMCKYEIKSLVNGDDKVANFYQNFTPDELHRIYDSGQTRLSFEYERILSDGTHRWVHNDINFLQDVDNGHLCVMLSAKDIDEKKKREIRITNAAQIDQMTNVYNRETAMDNIRHILDKDSGGRHILYMVDIDNFKMLNDTYGHQAGDRFLIEFSDYLKRNFRDSDVIGRIGGDEFFVFTKNIIDDDMIDGKARNILEIIHNVGDKYAGVGIGGSIGISVYPKDGTSLEELYSKADEALYRAKKSGKNRYSRAE